VLGELTSSIGRRGRVDREMADAYVRRLRKADRADAAEELQALAEVVDMAQGWVTWALAELETLDQTGHRAVPAAPAGPLSRGAPGRPHSEPVTAASGLGAPPRPAGRTDWIRRRGPGTARRARNEYGGDRLPALGEMPSRPASTMAR
jgi:hypothetical protein